MFSLAAFWVLWRLWGCLVFLAEVWCYFQKVLSMITTIYTDILRCFQEFRFVCRISVGISPCVFIKVLFRIITRVISDISPKPHSLFRISSGKKYCTDIRVFLCIFQEFFNFFFISSRDFSWSGLLKFLFVFFFLEFLHQKFYLEFQLRFLK